jgi:hypothetical protein
MSMERVLRSGPGSLFVVVLDQDVSSIEIEICVKRPGRGTWATASAL